MISLTFQLNLDRWEMATLLESSCYDAEYTNFMFESNDDTLAPYQILSSSNCKYILIRSPPPVLSFYSVSTESIIEEWRMRNDNIWTLYPSNFTKTIQISNDGCLVWSGEDDLTLHQICHHNNASLSQNNSLKASSNADAVKFEVMAPTSDPITWTPLLLIFMILIFLIYIICLCIVVCRKHSKTVDKPGGDQLSLEPEDSDQWTPKQIELMLDSDVMDEDDEVIDSEGDAVDPLEHVPSEREMAMAAACVSLDVFVAHDIMSPSCSNLKRSSRSRSSDYEIPKLALSEIQESDDDSECF